MSKIDSILEKNKPLIEDIQSHPSISNEILGVLKNIEKQIPENARDIFYTNLESLRITTGEGSECCLNAPIICIDYKLLTLADKNIKGEYTDFNEALVEILYHELLHIASTNYIVDLEKKKVDGYSGFIFNYYDINYSNNMFNGLTEGFTQYLTSLNTNIDNSNYTIQIECTKKLIDTVGIDALKQAFFNNKNGIQPIIDKLIEKNLDITYLLELEDMCHIDIIEHLSSNDETIKNQI